MSTISVIQREAETGHQIGHCSMPRRRIREANDIAPSVDVVMLDRPAMLCVVKPAATGTLREYACPSMFRPCVEQQLGKGHRNDVVCENYRQYYLKAQTRDMKGK